MRTVLIADDDADVVELVRASLEDERVRVVEARDGMTALQLATDLEPELIFLDVDLLDVSGLRVCRRLRREPGLAGVHIVMLKAAPRQEDFLRGLSAGATQFLPKPLSPVRLLSVVERLMSSVAWAHGPRRSSSPAYDRASIPAPRIPTGTSHARPDRCRR